MAPCGKNGSSLVGVVHQQVSYRITGVTRYDREDHFKKRLETDAKFSDTFSDTFTQHLLSVAVDYQQGIFSGTNSFIEELTGTAPMTVQVFIRKHAALYA